MNALAARAVSLVVLGLVVGALQPDLAAVASEQPVDRERVTPASGGESRGLQGEKAIAALGDGLPVVAERMGRSAASLRELLRTDSSARVDAGGFVSFVEPTFSGKASPVEGDAQFPLEGTFFLQSRPLSEKTIYLDFTGATVSNTAWNNDMGLPNGFHTGWSLDSDVENFSTAELQQIQSIWQRVAEDFAGRDVNVTTRDLGFDAIDRTNAADNKYGTTIVISNDPDAYDPICGPPDPCGGRSHIGNFDYDGAVGFSHRYLQPAWVFGDSLGNGSKTIAEAISHETGHTLGLDHDGVTTPPANYYPGHVMWAPIMGVGYQMPVTQWSRGEYNGASNHQNDLSVMASHGVPAIHDQAPSTPAGAPAIPSYPEYITSAADRDTYSLGVCGGWMTVSAQGADISPNLDLRLELLHGDTVVQSDDPPSSFISTDVAGGMNASITTNLPQNSSGYYLRVSGAGRGTAATGYTKYGSIGAYTINRSCHGTQFPGPSKPVNLTVETFDSFADTARLRWSPPVSNWNDLTDEYVISYAEVGHPDTSVTETTSGYATAHYIYGVVPGRNYEFSVAARNAAGITGPPASQTVTMPTPPKPTAPTILDATPAPNGRSATVKWKAPLWDGGSGLTSYRLGAFQAGADGWTFETVDPDLTSYTWTNLTPGATYQFFVVASNGPFESDPDYVDATMPTTPAAPVSVQVNPGSGGTEAEVTWSVPANGGSAITGYRVTRTNPRDATTPIRKLVQGTFVTWEDLTPGATYTFTVRAENAVGLGPIEARTITIPANATVLRRSRTHAS